MPDKNDLSAKAMRKANADLASGEVGACATPRKLEAAKAANLARIAEL